MSPVVNAVAARRTIIVIAAFLISCLLIDAHVRANEQAFLLGCLQRWAPRECRAALDGNYKLAGTLPEGVASAEVSKEACRD